MHVSSPTRGASILGVVVLLSLLSVGAVVLDSRPSIDSMSQVAASEEGAKKEDPKGTGQKCEKGYDYKISLDEKEKEKMNIERIEPNKCLDTNKKPIKTAADGRTCAKWESKVSFCRPDELFKVIEKLRPGRTKQCTEIEKKCPEGGSLDDFKDNAGGLLSEDVSLVLNARDASTEDLATVRKIGSALPDSFWDSWETVNDEKFEKTRMELEALEADKKNKEATYKTLDDAARRGLCGGYWCNEVKLEEARKNKEEAERKFALKKEELDRLEKNKVSLEPPREPPSGDKCDKTPLPAGCSPPDNGCTGFNCRDAGRGDPYRGDGNSSFGQPSSGYGPAQQSQQQCGSSNSGGLIGTIVSLFKKDGNNSNCVNGMLVPTCSLTASPQNITTAGQPVQLSWQSQNAYSASLSNAGNIPPQGSMTVNPQSNTTYSMFVQGARNQQTGQQLSGQCSIQVTIGAQGGSTDEAPKAEISCSPQLADVGMSVAISFGCRNLGTGAGMGTSAGTGFSTNNAPSGSATPVIEAPQLGSNNTVTYGLTCSKQGKTDTAQCTVGINRPSIVLVANPKSLKSGEESNIGWITSGMEECTISSPTLSGFTAENANNTSVSGVAKPPPLTQNASFVLSCTTKAGGTKNAEIEVKVGEDL